MKSTPSTRKLFQNRCPNSLRKLRRSLQTCSHFLRRRHWMSTPWGSMPFSLSRPNSPFLLLATVSTPCSIPCLFSCSSPWSQHLLELLGCAIWLLRFILILVGYAICLCLFLMLFVSAWLGWPISLTYHILECIAGYFSSLYYPSGGDCKHLDLPCLL